MQDLEDLLCSSLELWVGVQHDERCDRAHFQKVFSCERWAAKQQGWHAFNTLTLHDLAQNKVLNNITLLDTSDQPGPTRHA